MAEQWIYGIHAVLSLINNPHRKIFQLLINQDRQDQRLQELVVQAKTKEIPIEFISANKLNQRFPEANHQSVLAYAKSLPEFNENDLPLLIEKAKKPPLVLLLDSVTDPHNLGACLRTADASAVDFVVIPKDKSASLTPAASKVACGAAEFVPLVRVTNLARTIEFLKQAAFWIYGAAGEAKCSLYQLDLKVPIALVLGAEGSGLRRLTKDRCDELFSIPMYGSVESLNVSVATGICLYEVLRQRNS